MDGFCNELVSPCFFGGQLRNRFEDEILNSSVIYHNLSGDDNCPNTERGLLNSDTNSVLPSPCNDGIPSVRLDKTSIPSYNE